MTKLVIHKTYYKGVDGSSLSPFRCEQIIDLYNFVISNPRMDYVELQKTTSSAGLFKSGSVLRTFCPLLSKLGFVTYGGDESFTFTEEGIVFVKILKALKDCKSIDNPTEKDKILLNKLEKLKIDTIRLGIEKMYSNPNLKDHNLWFVMDTLSNLDYFVWNEFWLALYLYKEQNFDIFDICRKIVKDRNSNIHYEPFNENGQPIADTQWGYIKSLLEEADLINNHELGTSFNHDGYEFYFNLKNGK